MAEMIPLSRIDDNPWQSRTVYEAEALQELADDIRQHGLLQPPVGRIVNAEGGGTGPSDWHVVHALMHPRSLATVLDGAGQKPHMANGARVQLAFGHRRLRALRLIVEQDEAQADQVAMAIELRMLTDVEMATFAWSENAKRRDLSPIEAARAIERMIKDFGWTQEQVGERLGVSRPTVSNRLRLLRLPEEVQARVTAGEVSERQAMALAPLFDLPKAIRAKMEKENWGSSKPSVIVAGAGRQSSDGIRGAVVRGISQVTFAVNGAGWCAERLAGEGVISATCDGCGERVKLGDEWRCGRDVCRKAREGLWKTSVLEQAAAASGLAVLTDDESRAYGSYASLRGAPEPQKIVTGGCANLRIKWSEWGASGTVRVEGFPEAEIVCWHGEGGKCKCAMQAKAAVTRAAQVEAGDEEKAERELKRRVEKEVLEPAFAAVLEALLAGELGVWRRLAKATDYTSSPHEDWPLSRLQGVVARGLVKGPIGYQYGGQSFDQQRSRVEGALSNMDIRAPWKLTAAEAIGRKLDRLAEWVRTTARGEMWQVRQQLLTAEALDGNLANLDRLTEEMQGLGLADVGDEVRAAMLARIGALRETLLRLSAVVPDIPELRLSSTHQESLFNLLDVAPRSLVFDEALKAADAAVREEELRRRLGEIEQTQEGGSAA